MQTVDIQAGAAIVWGRQFLQSAMRLFSLRGKARESYLDQRVEERWDADYKNKLRINFVEIFASRLSNYAMNGSTVSCDDEELDELLYSVWGRASKWLPLALGVGRVYLVPYILGDRVYTDFVSQSNVIATGFEGDDLVGFVCVSDIKTVGDKRYARLTHHQYDADAKTYTVVNKDGMYIGMGSKDITFKSCDENQPAKFYVSSCPAHTITLDKARRIAVIEPDPCIKCFCCQELCPKDAIKVKKNPILKLVN